MRSGDVYAFGPSFGPIYESNLRLGNKLSHFILGIILTHSLWNL